MASSVAVLTEQPQLRAVLSPLRRQMLLLLREPDSAAGLARRLGTARQRVNYHLRALEDAGLVELVEERRRRGFVERVVRASARSFVVGPEGEGLDEVGATGDRRSSDTLLASAARTLSDVSILRARADAAGKRLLTLSIEGEVRLASPRAAGAFAEEVAAAIAVIARRHVAGAPARGRRYRFTAGLHPVITKTPLQAQAESAGRRSRGGGRGRREVANARGRDSR
jgi:DNA-binding transcriptional ArsR family regulator